MILCITGLLLLQHQLYGQAVTGRPGFDHSDTSAVALPMAQLRNKRSDQTIVHLSYVTDAGRQGLFVSAPEDKLSPDDSAMTLIGVNGIHYKRVVEGNLLNVQWFGATGNGGTDDWYAIQKAINYILEHDQAARTLYFPPGNYRISRPLIIARIKNAAYLHSTINLVGPTSAKNPSEGYASISPVFNNTFAIGIQLGKGVLVKGLAITGRFTFPNSLNAIQVDTLSFSEWTDRTVRQNTLSPYSGIVIDPFSDSTIYPHNSDMYPGLHSYCIPGQGRGGSTAIQIVDCSIRNFIVGVMITPSNQQNGELVDVTDCDISSNKVAYAMGQAQSKECHVVRLKCWGPTHTLFDNLTYGFRQGDGAGIPMVDGVNIAGSVKQLCMIGAASFGGSFHNVYAEGLFRLGYVGGPATLSFEDCQFDFSSQDPGLPYPDFYVQGNWVSFRNCMLRLYPGVPGARLILSGTNNHYEGGTTNAPPVAINIDNNSVYPNPTFQNIYMYYSTGILGNSNPGIVDMNGGPNGSNGNGIDPVYFGNTYRFLDPYGHVAYKFTYNNSYERLVTLSGKPVIHVNKSNWTAYFTLGAATDMKLLKPGDFILTSGLHDQDQFQVILAPTYPVGFIRRIGHDTVYLDNLALGIQEGMSLRLWMDYFVNAKAAFTGDMAIGSNTIVNAQGVLPYVGERPDIPMLLPGSYVSAVNTTTGVISFSTANITDHAYKDYTFMNGYPSIEMYSNKDPAALQKNGKTLYGGADYFRYDSVTVNTYDLGYPFKGSHAEAYKIINTNINGDTTLHRLNYRRL